MDNLREIVTVEMGSVSFNSEAIPVTGQAREVLEEEIQVNDQTFTFCAATVGNPHCVIFVDELSEAETRRFGPLLESDSRFPNRTNVQFAKVIDRTTLQIEIWERGAGYTLASGSSSTAVAAVAYRLGLCEADVAVKMPGGALHIHLNEQFHATLAGPATKICDGVLTGEMIATNWVQSAAGNNDPLILVPADVPGSWRAMLAIYDRLDRNDRLFQWESESDYHRNKARKSRPMLDLIRNLAQTDLRQRFRIGGGLFGVGLRMESDSEKRMVAISVTVDRQIEVRLLDITDFGPLPPVIDQVVCDQEKAVQHIRSYAQRL